LIPSDTHIANWKPITRPYEAASVRKGIWQVVNTFGPYTLLWVVIYYSHAVSWWLTLPLAILAGGLLVRIFIILHDCGHGSFFPSRLANDITGSIAGVLTFTPYEQWRGKHFEHHATSGDLGRRGTGDVWKMTVREYHESSRWKRLAYRLVRNPFVLFMLVPLFLFVIGQRFSEPRAGSRERKSVWWTNVAVFLLATTLAWLFGVVPYVLIQLMVLLTAGAAGVWLFYVQHQFKGAYWERSEDWDYTAAALEGSSFYRLPGVLQWFTGNIGFHHVHHLSSRIPNYNLKQCHQSHALLREVKPLTLFSSLGAARLRLWSERQRELVSFRHLKRAGRRSHD